MPAIKETDIRRIDMTLLLVLASLLRSGRTTATAKELGVTQSSVSHSLAKLRDIFGDELFIRKPNGLAPTARALSLQPIVEDILRLTRGAVRSAPFDPSTAKRLVRIAGTDYPCTVLAAPLLERLEREAPGIRVSFRPFVRQRAVEALVSGELDFAIGPFGEGKGGHQRRILWEDAYVVCVRKNHPDFRTRCTLDAYTHARHVLVSQTGDLTGIVDSVLAQRNLARSVVAAAPYFMTALSIVARSDAIATMPASIARAHASELGLRVFPCPMPVRKLAICLLSSRHNQGDALLSWIADILSAISPKDGERKRR